MALISKKQRAQLNQAADRARQRAAESGEADRPLGPLIGRLVVVPTYVPRSGPMRGLEVAGFRGIVVQVGEHRRDSVVELIDELTCGRRWVHAFRIPAARSILKPKRKD